MLRHRALPLLWTLLLFALTQKRVLGVDGDLVKPDLRGFDRSIRGLLATYVVTNVLRSNE